MKNEEEVPPDDVDYNLIEPQLYLGNLSTAMHVSTLRELKITHILTVESESLDSGILATIPDLKVSFIEVDDLPHCDLLRHFDQAYEFIYGGLASGGAVLVHCYHGMSRSAAVVAAYLMKKYKIDSDKAVKQVREQRPIACPNDGFMAQLRLYGDSHCLMDDVTRHSPAYNTYRYGVMLAAVRTEPHRLVAKLREYLADLHDAPAVHSAPGLACAACGTVLCSQHSILDHREGSDVQTCRSVRSVPPVSGKTGQEAPTSLVIEYGKQDEEPEGAPVACPKGVYILPQPWMAGMGRSKTAHKTDVRLAGVVTCSGCSREIGRYHWLRGVACHCLGPGRAAPQLGAVLLNGDHLLRY